MILTGLGPTPAYRTHTPKWATQPTSGAGAARHGGRVNRPGIAALYLSFEPETALREYQQTSTLLPPGTLVSYQVQAEPVVDFTSGYEPGTWAPLWEDFGCDWRELWFNRAVEPPSWVLADEVIATGAKGIMFASTVAHDGINVVLYTEWLTGDDRLDVHDPGGVLPRNQDSWR